MKRTRDKWEPTEHSLLCSKHFEEWCFEQDSNLSVGLGLGKGKTRLKPDAIPTLFERPVLLKRKIPATDEQPHGRNKDLLKKEVCISV